MPKIKTNKSAKKRLKMTRTGLYKRAKAGKSHLLAKKSSKHKRRLRKSTHIDKTSQKVIKRLLPYTEDN